MERLDTGLAIHEEGAARLSVDAGLRQSPGLRARDVVDPIRVNAVGSGNDLVSFVQDDEGPAVSGKEWRGSVKAGAIGVNSAAEETAGGGTVQVKEASVAGGLAVWSMEG